MCHQLLGDVKLLLHLHCGRFMFGACDEILEIVVLVIESVLQHPLYLLPFQRHMTRLRQKPE